MATNNVEITWGSTTDYVVSSLHSLASGDIWTSATLDDASPSNEWCRISYSIEWNATPVAGDSLIFRLAIADEAASSEIIAGGCSGTEGSATAAADVAAIQQGCPVVWQHAWATSLGTTFEGVFDMHLAGPSFVLTIEANGEAIASSGSIVRYRLGTSQIQAAV